MMGRSWPDAVVTARAASTSPEDWTKDWATRSNPAFTAKRRSSSSFVVREGRERLRRGTLTPLREARGPPIRTRHTRSSPRRVSTRSSRRPSASRIASPGSTSRASPLWEMGTTSASPSRTSGVRVTLEPVSKTVPAPISPTRMRGPARSARRATGRPTSPSRSRTTSAMRRCSSRVPWEKFSRATSIPWRRRASRVSGTELAGPRVHTIFVRFAVDQPFTSGLRGGQVKAFALACRRAPPRV